MRIPGVKATKTLSRWLKARLLGGAMILGYHRVANAPMDEYEVCVTPKHFEEHMDAVRRVGHPISLSKLVEHLKENTLPARSIVVTFDDGYADNLYQAKPLLEKYQIPATVFVCTGYTGREFWWDELARRLILSHEDPRNLQLQVGGSAFQRNQTIGSSEKKGLGEDSLRRKLINSLYHFLLRLDVDDREATMDVIRGWSALPVQEIAHHRAMDAVELLDLAAGGLIELGAHTETHPILSDLSTERQREEVVSSKQILEELQGRQVTGFAYPNGKATVQTRRIVKNAGFEYACTSLHDTVRPGCDLYELTRFWQDNVDGDKFMQNLNLWMNMQSN